MEDYTGTAIPEVQAFVLQPLPINFLARPQFIAYRIGPRPPLVHLSAALGALNIGWTSHEPRSERGRDGVIFEFYRPQLKFK